MSRTLKRVCCLYRTMSLDPVDMPEMERQRQACLAFVKAKGWRLLREFWQAEGDASRDPADDALSELKTGAEQGRFDILLVSEFDRIGRIPLECSFAAGFFERGGVDVWAANAGHIGRYTRTSA